MFYGWKPTWTGFFGNLLLQGGGIFIMNALMEPLSLLHGWSRGTIGTIMAFSSLAGTLSMPLLGSLALRWSLRRLMLVGALMGGGGYIMMGQTSSPFLFTLSFAAVWIGGQACGGVIANALVCNWFIRFRGRAFGVVNMGTSMSGVVLPLTALILVRSFSVPVATAFIGCGVLMLLVPLCLFFVRDRPEDMGLAPDGLPAPEKAGAPAAHTVFIPWKDLLRNPECYRVGLIFGLGIMMAAGVVGQLKPRFSDLGFNDYTAMAFMCLAAFCGAMGKFLWGWVSDILTPLKTTKLIIFCNILGLSVAFLPANLFTALLFAVYSGGCVGGFWAVFPNAVAYVFGRDKFVSVYRFASAFVSIKALGYYVMGMIYEHTHSYDGAYAFFIGPMVLAFILLLFVHDPARDAVQAGEPSGR